MMANRPSRHSLPAPPGVKAARHVAAVLLVLSARAACAPVAVLSQPPPTRACPPTGQLDAAFLRPFASEHALDLSLCGLTSVVPGAFDDMLLLQSLTMAGNRLETLHPDTFVACSRLVSLDISDNPALSVPEDGAFLNSASLESMDLRNCGIKSISSEALQGLSKLWKLDLQGNAVCGEKCDDFVSLLLEKTDRHFNHDDFLKVYRKSSRTLLVSQNEYLRRSVAEDASAYRRSSTVFRVSALGVIVMLSAVAMIATFGKRFYVASDEQLYKEVPCEPEEIVIPSQKRELTVRYRTSWKQHIQVIYVLLQHSTDYVVIPARV